MPIKQSIKDRKEVVADFLKKRIDGSIDRWGHVKYTDTTNNKLYRYKIMTNVVRLETKTSLGDWILLRSYNMKKIEALALKDEL